MIMLIGLPASGKTTWANKHVAENPLKRYNVIGTSVLLERMKVSLYFYQKIFVKVECQKWSTWILNLYKSVIFPKKMWNDCMSWHFSQDFLNSRWMVNPVRSTWQLNGSSSFPNWPSVAKTCCVWHHKGGGISLSTR